MSRRQQIQQAKLTHLEQEFHPLLLELLRQCAAGRWGLFGQNEVADPEGIYWHWPEAERLKVLAQEITSIREQFGQNDPKCERFLQLCSLRGPNVPGEPKLAEVFLVELGGDSLTPSQNQ
ncbi:MAG TPA: hypothetical protein VMD97_13665 [Candidatus Aquilonibacter sp.]|nr:hypothetical protein [Candidatus Aquilonibacter sp.]